MTENLPATIPKCPVCGQGINLEGSVSKCSRCETPQHEDCTGYQGGCAIFGCVKSAKYRAQVYERPHLISRQVEEALRRLTRYMVNVGKEIGETLDSNEHYTYTFYQTVRDTVIGVSSLAVTLAAIPVAFAGLFTSFYSMISEGVHRQRFIQANFHDQELIPPKSLDSKECEALVQISSRYDGNPAPSNYIPASDEKMKFTGVDRALEALIDNQFDTKQQTAIDDELNDREKNGDFRF